MSDLKIQIKNWSRQQTRMGKKAIYPIVILGLLSSLSAVGLAWCMAEILGVLLSPSSIKIAHPEYLLLTFICLFFLRGCIFYCENVYTAKIGLKARKRLRNQLVQQITQIGPSILHQQSGGTLATLIVDQVESLDGYFSRWLPASILWILLPTLILVCIYCIQPFSALIIGICGLMVPIAQAVFGIGAAVAARQQFLAMTRLQSRFLDRIQGIATIVLFGRSEDEAQKLKKSADELRQRTMKILRVAFLSSASIDCAMIVAIILVAMMDVGQFLNQGTEMAVPVTHVLFSLIIIPEFFAPLRSLALAYQDKARLTGTANSVVELPKVDLYEGERHSLDQTFNFQQITISFDQVSYSWDEKRGRAIDSLSFEVPSHETALLIGRSGAGKSTIIEMLLGFIRPISGKILFNNIDITSLSHKTLSSFVAWIGQKPVIFSGTIKENILFAKPNATDEELQHAVSNAAMNQYLSVLPQGLDTQIGEGGYGLSGGEAQRIAIARAYLKDAPLLLLDEPTAHLDPMTEQDIFTSLIKLSENRTVILATHSAEGQKLKGLHLHIEHGRLIAKDTVG